MILYDQGPGTIYDFIAKGGISALLFIIIYGGYKRWWVFGWQYKDLEKRLNDLAGESNGWQELALRSQNLLESLDELRKSPSS